MNWKKKKQNQKNPSNNSVTHLPAKEVSILEPAADASTQNT